VPLYFCNECEHRFSGNPGKHKTYPLRYVLEAVSTYNLGHSLTDTQSILRQRFHVEIPERTIRAWLTAHRPIATYHRLRSAARSRFRPSQTVRVLELEHRQVYRFQLHQAKLELLLELGANPRFRPLLDYLDTVGEAFPHELFRAADHRSSKYPATFHPPITRKTNHATEMAERVLPSSPNNRRRHETLQRFMLLNDSVTIAVEIPVYLSADDIAYFRKSRFTLPMEASTITGHIDFLQIRNGYIHILDYKPEARKETHAHVQLTIYALALSRRVNLPLKYFKCGWFDEKDYFEFFPLQGVYQPHQ
jgi:ATP-dependent exoDNAse (exonuclease V) beta subunit